MSDQTEEASGLRRFPCRYHGCIEIDKRYNFPAVMPWLLAEVKRCETQADDVHLDLVGCCLTCWKEDNELFSHHLSHIRRFIKSKSFRGLVVYIFDSEGGTSMAMHAFMMNDADDIDRLYQNVQTVNAERRSSVQSSNSSTRGSLPMTSTPNPTHPTHRNSDTNLGNIHALLNRGHQIYEVLYLGTVRLRRKTVDNFDDIIQQVYSCIQATGGMGIRQDSYDTGDLNDDMENSLEESDEMDEHKKRRRVLSSCSVGADTWDSSRNALLVIGSSAIRLFNLALRQLQWERPIRDVASILSSYRQPDHIGLVAECEPELMITHGEGYRYALYIFQCASKDLASTTFATLKRTFLNCQDARRLCELCPINLFNRLCDRVNSLSPEEVNSVIAEHMLEMDTKDTDIVGTWMRNCDADTLEAKNEMLIALLRRLSSDKQLSHTHTRQATDGDLDDKKADLLTRAKNTFFSSLKRSLYSPSTKKLSGGSGTRARATTHLGIEASSDASDSVTSTPSKKLSIGSDSGTRNRSQGSFGLEHYSMGDSSEVYRIPPDVSSPLPADVSESFEFPTNGDNFDGDKLTSSKIPDEQRPRSSTLDTITSDQKVGRRTHKSGDQTEVKPQQHRRRSNSGGVTATNNVGNRRHSMRFKIFSSVVSTPRPDTVMNEEEESDDDLSQSLGSSTIRLSRLRRIERARNRYRALWRKAISEIRMLIRMEKQNHAALNSNSSESHLLLLGLQSYEDVSSTGEAAHRWSSMSDDVKREDLMDAVKAGVPRGRRADAWHLIMKSEQRNDDEEDETTYTELTRQLTVHQHAIIIDVGRTFPSHPMFADPENGGQLALFNILKAYSLYDKEIGYCQGISFIVGILLMHMPEQEAFETLKFIMFKRNYRQLFTPDMSHLQVCLYQFSRLVHDHLQDLHQHFENLGVSASFYAAPWFLSLFATQFSLGFVARAFDLLLVFGQEAVFRIGLMLLTENAAQLTHSNTFEGVCDFLRSVLPTMSSVTAARIFDQAFRIDLSTDLHTYAVEYRVLNEEVMAGERSTHDYSRRLQDLSRELARQKRELSMRYEVADRVVTSQRSEIATLRRDLTNVRAEMRGMGREREELRDLVAKLRDALLRGCPEPGEVLGEKLAIEVAAALS